jgi:hypothetical protein
MDKKAVSPISRKRFANISRVNGGGTSLSAGIWPLLAAGASDDLVIL